jgi:hypothetical protein
VLNLDERMALKAWQMLGGCDWSGLPMVAEILGIDDIEGLARSLAHLRNELHKDGSE